MPGDDRDPLEGLLPALASVLLALLVSMPLAAFVGAALGADYQARALIYLALLGWVVTGAVILFVVTVRAERQPLSLRRVLVWTASIWIWPLLLAARRRR
ncbi:MAG TPA: hypothetical protein VMU33_02255 [Burkholderiaceae bacterium]|nr:hypothetical protein [Burkholderiaceae bacterium]